MQTHKPTKAMKEAENRWNKGKPKAEWVRIQDVVFDLLTDANHNTLNDVADITGVEQSTMHHWVRYQFGFRLAWTREEN
jgi:hypothetical protein